MKLRLFMYLGLLCGGLYSCNDDPTPLPTSKNFITKYQNPVSICAIVSGSLETSVPTETYNVVSLQIRPYENTEDCFTKDLVDEAQFEVLAAQFKDTQTRPHTDGFQRNNAKCLDEKGISRFVPHSSI